MPADLARTLAAAGLFRMAVPKDAGGLELEPAMMLRAIEAAGAADASVGWCVMIGATSGVTAADLPTPLAREIFGPADSNCRRRVRADGESRNRRRRLCPEWPLGMGVGLRQLPMADRRLLSSRKTVNCGSWRTDAGRAPPDLPGRGRHLERHLAFVGPVRHRFGRDGRLQLAGAARARGILRCSGCCRCALCVPVFRPAGARDRGGGARQCPRRRRGSRGAGRRQAAAGLASHAGRAPQCTVDARCRGS